MNDVDDVELNEIDDKGLIELNEHCVPRPKPPYSSISSHNHHSLIDVDLNNIDEITPDLTQIYHL